MKSTSMKRNPDTIRLSRISSFSVIVMFIAISLLGIVLLPSLPVRLSPSEALPSVSVSFSMPGSSARAVEQEATSRLESALSRVTGVKAVKSRSRSGSASITLELDRNTSIATARFETSMIVRQMWDLLPENVSYPSVSVRQIDDDASRPFISYTVNADLPPSEIMAYAEARLRPSLSRIDGVAKVDLSGAMPMEWDITYDAPSLSALNISPDQIAGELASHLGSDFLGVVKTSSGQESEWIRIALAPSATSASSDPDTSPVDLSRIFITKIGGEVITLDKIATLRHVGASPSGYYRINGLNSIYLSITATPDANQIDLSRKVKECLDGIALPRNFMLTLGYDASERISEELDKIYFRTGLTVFILLLFVALITLNWRYLLVITISLAMNLGVAFVIYWLLDVEIQLYSLAGITISLNLIIDNLIVMTEHITRRHNLRAFSAILAATLTTVGALSVIFFLDEQTLLSLKDFVVVVIVNLTVSLFVALFLVPALAERINLRRRSGSKPSPKKSKVRRYIRRFPVFLTRVYSAVITFLLRRKPLVYIIFILAFGLPVFMLPEKIESETAPARWYNATFGSPLYKQSIKPWVDRCLGGSLRLFAEKVSDGNYWGRSINEPTLYVNANLPNGATLSQMNELMKKMEAFLAGEDGIRQFQTSVYSGRRGSITVYFKPEKQRTGYPYQLKSKVVSKALTLGGGSWGVYGLEDTGFNNDVRQSAGSYRVAVRGYNYDDLYDHARVLEDSLLAYKRIKEVTINSEFSYWKDDYTEFYLEFDSRRLAADSLAIADIYGALRREIGRDITATSIVTDAGSEEVRLISSDRGRDVWGLMHIPLQVGKRLVRIADYAVIEPRQTPPDVVKENQEYLLCLQYEYIGSPKQGDKVLEKVLKNFNRTLPIGYTAERVSYSWGDKPSAGRYALLLLIAVIIFFISSILFNSLRQPIAIIFVIPVSFIGVFLTFYLFDLKFDQGGFAAFILLCGITVNAAIYIINEYNSLLRKAITTKPILTGPSEPSAPTPREPNSSNHVEQDNSLSVEPISDTRMEVSHKSPGRLEMLRSRLYIKAFRVKITAVLLTVLSTVLGFIPFLIGDVHESFWFALAAGTMGGLVFSLTAIFLLLPLMILPAPTGKRRARKTRRKNNPL